MMIPDSGLLFLRPPCTLSTFRNMLQAHLFSRSYFTD